MVLNILFSFVFLNFEDIVQQKKNRSISHIKKSIILLFCICFTNTSKAGEYKIIEAIATRAGGFDIPIIVQIPENINEKLPVVFYIHGGGWSGGTATEVPNATLPIDARFLGEQMGVIYVGLAYRCKGNKGTFALAIKDLEASVAWFINRAERFHADVSRIGFSGSSAGTTLSAVMAQKYSNCKLYIGSEGMYNLVDLDNELSHFPSEESRSQYGLTTNKERFQASAYYNLRRNPPSALLLHGKDDWLCNFTQSQRFAEKIIARGGKAKVVLYDGINHSCRRRGYPEVLRNSLLEIINLYIKEFGIKGVNIKKIEDFIDAEIINDYPTDNITSDKLVGAWKGKWGQFLFNNDGTGDFIKAKQKVKKQLNYKIHKSFFEVAIVGESRIRQFYLRKNENIIYELILENTRWKSRRIDYRKAKN